MKKIIIMLIFTAVIGSVYAEETESSLLKTETKIERAITGIRTSSVVEIEIPEPGRVYKNKKRGDENE